MGKNGMIIKIVRGFMFVFMGLLLVTCSSSQSGSGGITVEREPNNIPGQDTKAYGMNLVGTISHPGDYDWFELMGQEGYNPQFCIYHEPYVDLDFQVWNGAVLVATAVGASSPDCIRANVPGKCFIKVYSYKGTGPYRIQIQP